MKTVAFYTLGCKVNQYETEAMEELFVKAGYRKVDFEEYADVYIINTCTVTHHGDRKSRQVIRRAKRKNPEAIVAVVGCYAQVSPDEVLSIPGVDLVIGTEGKGRIVELVEKAREEANPLCIVKGIEELKEFEELNLESYHRGRTRAFVKIQEGCRQFCTYCIIPYARGPLRSRHPQKVVDQVTKLVRQGYKEIVLTGIHITSYGKDLGDVDLLDVIELVHRVDGLERIRLSSLEPTFITKEFIDRMSYLDKLCRHFHLSLQSGCDETLKRMGRRYTTGEYRNIVEMLRSRLPGVAVTTDVMVGFPGETREEFNETYRFLQEICLSDMHIFKYSPRKGTPAANFENQVDPAIKEERSRALIELARSCRKRFFDKFLGEQVGVLFEQRNRTRKECFEGLTDNYIRVLVPAADDLHNQLLTVRLLESHDDYMAGELVN